MITWNEGETGGTSFTGVYLDVKELGGFKAVTNRLITLGAIDAGVSDKVTHEFKGVLDNRIFTLYDYKGDREFHIGGHQPQDGLAFEAWGKKVRTELHKVLK